MQFEEGFDYCGTCMPRVRSFVDDINELRADTARMLVKMFGAIRRNYPDVKIVPLPQGPFEL